jgi:hypothetical protein
MNRRWVVLLSSLVVLFLPLFPARAGDKEPATPKELEVPPGHKLVFKFDARGVQIYKAIEGKEGKLEWALEAPLADLFDSKGVWAGCHYEGPAWEAADGSKVVRDRGVDVKSAPAPNAKNDIPWLLLKVKEEAGKGGALSKAVYIQRLQTEGGKPPAEAPKRPGTKLGVAYKAVYYFFGPEK